jgi:hypothetical protein
MSTQNNNTDDKQVDHFEKLKQLKLSNSEPTLAEKEAKIESDVVSKTLSELKTGILLSKSKLEFENENKTEPEPEPEQKVERSLDLSDLKKGVGNLRTLDLMPSKDVLNKQTLKQETIKSIETTLSSSPNEIKIKEKQLTIKDFEDIIKTSSGLVKNSGPSKNLTKKKSPRKIIRAGAKKIKKTSGNKRVYKDVFEFEQALVNYLKDNRNGK